MPMGKIYKAPRPKPRRSTKKSKALTKRVKKLENKVNKSIDAKQIYVQTSGNLNDTSDSATITLIDGLAQGVADTGTGSTVSTGSRIGNSINVQSISCKLLLDASKISTAVTNPNAKTTCAVRVIMVNSASGEALALSEVLRDVSSMERAMVSHYETAVQQGKKYQILFDKVYHFSNAVEQRSIDIYKKWKEGYKAIYDDNQTEPSNFKPRLLLHYFEKANADNTCDYYIEAKCRYFDA